MLKRRMEIAWMCGQDPHFADLGGWRQCPYNASHMVKSNRICDHVTRCAARYMGQDMYECPFNYTHRVHESLIDKHVQQCRDKARAKGLIDNEPEDAIPQVHMMQVDSRYKEECRRCLFARREEEEDGIPNDRLWGYNLVTRMDLHYPVSNHTFTDIIVPFPEKHAFTTRNENSNVGRTMYRRLSKETTPRESGIQKGDMYGRGYALDSEVFSRDTPIDTSDLCILSDGEGSSTSNSLDSIKGTMDLYEWIESPIKEEAPKPQSCEDDKPAIDGPLQNEFKKLPNKVLSNQQDVPNGSVDNPSELKVAFIKYPYHDGCEVDYMRGFSGAAGVRREDATCKEQPELTRGQMSGQEN